MSDTPLLDRFVEIGAHAISPAAPDQWRGPLRTALIAIAVSNRGDAAEVPPTPPAPSPVDASTLGTMEAGSIKVSAYGRVGHTAPGISPQQQVVLDREAASRARRLDPVIESQNTTELGLPEPSKKAKPDGEKAAALKMAKAMGFTGDMCTACGSPNMQRSGSCMTCADCGTTSGCS